MRILFATTHKHLPELRGGMEVNTHELAREFIARGNVVGVLCGLAGVGSVGLMARLRIKLLRRPAPRDTGLGYPVWRAWDAVAVMARVASLFRPDVIIVQGGARFDPLVRACLAVNVPVVCYLHTQDLLPLPDDVQGNRNLHFVANSKFTVRLHPEKNIREIFRPLIRSDDYAVSSDRSSAVFINPSKHKGLEVVMGLAAARPDVLFLFVVNRHAPPEMAASLSGAANIRVIGPFSDMRRVYAQAKIVLAPSQWLETWGRVASEAHFSGIPVLASNTGGLPEAVGPGGLCLAPEAPLENWLAAFCTLWDEDVRYRRFCDAALRYAQRRDIDANGIVESFLTYLAMIVLRGWRPSAHHSQPPRR